MTPKFKGHKQTDFFDSKEVWRDVDGWPYQVSSLGRVRSLRAIRPHSSADGYQRVHFYDGSNIAHPLIHRLVAEAFIGPAPSTAHVVSHINGNPSDNRPENLEWATVLQNATRRKEHGNYPSGANVYNAKLTNEQAAEIRRMHKSGTKNISRLARAFGVSRPCIKRVVDGVGYKDAGGLAND